MKRLSSLATDGLSCFVGSMASITSLRKNALLTELKSRCQAFVDRRVYSWRNLLSTTASSDWSHDAIDDASPDSFVGLHLTKLLGCKVDDVFVEEDGSSRLHKNMREWLKQLKGHREFKLSFGAIWILFAVINRGRYCSIGEALTLPTELPLVLPKLEGLGDGRPPKQVFDNWLLRLGEMIEKFCANDPSQQDTSLLKVAFSEVQISIHLRYPSVEKLKPILAEWQAAISRFLDPNRTEEVFKAPCHTQIVMPLLRFYMEGVIPFGERVQFGPGCKTRFEIRSLSDLQGSGCVVGFFDEAKGK